MVRIEPFRGYRYDLQRVSSADAVIAPPYDVIDAALKAALISREQYNIANITKGKAAAAKGEDYAAAARRFSHWCEEGVLCRDEHPAYYIYEQQFTIKDQQWTRTGFIGLLELEPFCTGAGEGAACNGVHQHEETLPKDIADRLELLRATRANFGQIFAIYDDPTATADRILNETKESFEPLMSAFDDEGVRHRLWALTENDAQAKLDALMASSSLIIADGHHRYKTALAYRNEHPGLDGARYRMMTFVNMESKGLVVLPTHRLINTIAHFDAERLLDGIRSQFEVERFGYGTAEEEEDARATMFAQMHDGFTAGEHIFGLYAKTNAYYTLKLKLKDDTVVLEEGDHSDAWRALDVTILHKLILEQHLGIDQEKLRKGSHGGGAFVEYIKDIGNAIETSLAKVNTEGYQAVFFMNPTRIEEVAEVSMNHEIMPQKSTFFYPKIYTGFVINRLEDGEGPPEA